ncbi:MAG: hypothetical protein Q7T39_24520 [Polaromonas sp.]|nr:hypothetical protein [Polaromonas sp.]
MDALTFISKMTDALAWPFVALVLGLLLRKKVLDLIPGIRRLKAGPVEAEFELATKQLLSNAAVATSQAEPSAPAKSLQAPEQRDDKIIARLLNARNDPAGMILEGWANVDGELFRLGNQMGSLVDPLTSTTKVYESVMASDILPSETRRLVRDLRELRNKVAHAIVKPTAEAAQDYIVAVDRVVELIRNYRKNLPNYGSKNR